MRFSEIPLEGVKGVLLDLDNCIYSHNQCHHLALDSCYSFFIEKLKPDMSRHEFDALYKQSRKEVVKRLFPQGICRSRILYFQQMIENIGLPNKACYAYHMEKLYFDTFIPAMQLDEEVIPFLETCKDNRIAVCFVTNYNTQYQMRKILHFKIDHLVDYLVTSEEAGTEKPLAPVFKAGLAKLSLGPEDVIMVGDNPKNDIEGAEKLGIRSFLVIAK